MNYGFQTGRPFGRDFTLFANFVYSLSGIHLETQERAVKAGFETDARSRLFHYASIKNMCS
jgi:hypothetical protein